MSKKQTGRAEGYLLPLFVDNLRKELKLSQEAFQNEYIKLLEASITSSVEELLRELNSHISTDESDMLLGIRLDSCIDKKAMIVFYYQLRKDIEMLKETKKKIKQSTYDNYADKINKRLASFIENVQLGSHGGIELRSIRNLLKYNVEPSDNNASALHFILTRLFPSLLSRQSAPNTAHVDYRFFNGTLESRENIVERLLSIETKNGRYEIDDENLKDDVVEKLLDGKRTYERLKARSKEEAEKNRERRKAEEYSSKEETEKDRERKKAEEYSKMFEDIWQQISIPCTVTYDRHEHYYSIGATFTKNILSGLLGYSSSVANQKWDEISRIVYELVRVAEEQSNALWLSRDMKTEMLSFENIFITEFIILFFANKEIRRVMNELPSADLKNSEDAAYE